MRVRSVSRNTAIASYWRFFSANTYWFLICDEYIAFPTRQILNLLSCLVPNAPRVPLAPDRYLLIHDSVHGRFPGTVEASPTTAAVQ